MRKQQNMAGFMNYEFVDLMLTMMSQYANDRISPDLTKFCLVTMSNQFYFM